MKTTVISAIAALAIGATGLSATQFYVDEQGQVFTTEGEGRKALQSKESSVFSKTSKLEFSGTHYLGFINKEMKEGDSTNNFEMRRNYVQVKAHVIDDPKSYLRVTLDATYSNSTANDGGHADVYVKY
ncbi:MAG: hypothetical protein PHX65_06300, partial [Sulfurimonas sp.]|nr:hypothetical protein [Sulfurimonas sp.]